MGLVISIGAQIVCMVIGWHLGRTEGHPLRGLLYGLFGPMGLFFFWAGRDWRRDRDARGAATHSV